jgi:hypothetical protein
MIGNLSRIVAYAGRNPNGLRMTHVGHLAIRLLDLTQGREKPQG